MSYQNYLMKVLPPTFSSRLINHFYIANDLVNFVTLRGLHREVGNKYSRSYGIQPRAITKKLSENLSTHLEARKEKEGFINKKAIKKEWTERTQSWFSREQNESDLVKHIEVLQRFAERYNAIYGDTKLRNCDKTKDSTDGTSKKLLKIIDKKQPYKKYSTYVSDPNKNKNEVESKQDNYYVRSFITLEKEPRIDESSSRGKVPISKLENPDSIKFSIPTPKPIKRRLYSVVNQKFRNKEFESYLKKSYSNAEKERGKEVGFEPSIGEYYNSRYTAKRLSKAKTISPSKTDTVSLSAKLKDRLVDERRISTTTNKNTKLQPTIHAKTSLLVKQSHLPLQLCKNMKATQSENMLKAAPSKKLSQQRKTDQRENQKMNSNINDSSLIKRLMKYIRR